MVLEIRTPSPVRQLVELSGPATLWVKDDGECIASALDSTHSLIREAPARRQLYGGNKVRKLAQLMPYAVSGGARRVLTIGTAGSHHALATALLARVYGLESVLFLLPQPFSAHAECMLKANLRHATRVVTVSSPAALAYRMASTLRPNDYVIPPGASNARGAGAFAQAALELERQVTRGELPEPETIVVALGSGGTAAGLAAGLVASRLRSRVVAVDVVNRGHWTGFWTRNLAARILRSRGLSSARLDQHLEIVEPNYGSYGVPHAAGNEAAARAGRLGLTLEPVYTAKAFAFALTIAQSKGARGPVLYWHTYSACEPPREPAEIPSASAWRDARRLLVPC
ncbi:MAG TPA: pyridoxal-phosphate dependent enzyme [Polyangiaceae bacterium]|nr:pyridoxal-phosphate dependent enzyme [Polyangiaceae bacterium]